MQNELEMQVKQKLGHYSQEPLWMLEYVLSGHYSRHSFKYKNLPLKQELHSVYDDKHVRHGDLHLMHFKGI